RRAAGDPSRGRLCLARRAAIQCDVGWLLAVHVGGDRCRCRAGSVLCSGGRARHRVRVGANQLSVAWGNRAVSDTYDAGSRTERATPRRLQKAREEGQVVRAHAVAGAAVLVVGAGVIAIAGAKVAGLFESSLVNGL